MTDSSVRAEASRLLEQITLGEWRARFLAPNFVEVIADGARYTVVHWAGFDESAVPLGQHKANAAFIGACPRLLRALLAEGPDPETITRLQQLVETWTERQQTATERAKVAANYEDDDESPLPMGWEFYRGVETGIRDCAKDLSDLLTGLAASQEKKAPTREQEQP
jgi:hypothetical protein